MALKSLENFLEGAPILHYQNIHRARDRKTDTHPERPKYSGREQYIERERLRRKIWENLLKKPLSDHGFIGEPTSDGLNWEKNRSWGSVRGAPTVNENRMLGTEHMTYDVLFSMGFL